MRIKNILLIIIIFLLSSCSNKTEQQSSLNEKNLNLQVLETYELAMNSLKQGDVLFAAKKFNEVEIMYPQSEWAPKSLLMAAYSYYSQDYYVDAIAELDRFIKIYKVDSNLNYAYYLLALCYFEQIVDEKKDLDSIIKSKNYFNYIIKNYPNTDYATDAKFKIDLVNDILASKEMYIGKYYFDKKKWIPAIRRFQTVVEDYETTIYTEEALHRLVEIYYILGLKQEAVKYAKLLGYNYQSSQWYEKSYSVFNKNYKLSTKQKIRDKNGIIRKFKSLIN